MEENAKYIKRCFTLAEKGSGFVSPNPMVGAVIVKNDNVIGEGVHQKYGEAHAEVNAINSAKEDVAGATLYCNLEPCVHEKKRSTAPFMVIDTLTLSSGMPSNRIFMSSTLSIATPALPTSPTTRGWSLS